MILLCLGFAIWVFWVEWRMYHYQKSIGLLVESVQTLLRHVQDANNETESSKMQTQAIINALNVHSNDIGQLILAVNHISNEVFENEILQDQQHPTIQ